jgi:hypothetical protein
MTHTFDASKLTTIKDCWTIIGRAEKRGLDSVRQAAERRRRQLAEDENHSAFGRDFWKSLEVYERMLTEKNDRTTHASYSRRAVANKGLRQAAIDWVMHPPADGFDWLVRSGLVEHTVEFLVVKHRSLFPEKIVRLAQMRLNNRGAEWAAKIRTDH